jgi:Putative adhesin
MSPGNTVPPETTGSPRTAQPLPLTPGRRAALAIGVPVCLLLIAYGGFDLIANLGVGHFPVRYTAPASTKSLTVTTDGGQLSLRPTAGRVTLTGTARYTLIRSTLTARTADGNTALGYHCVTLPTEDCALDATISAPAAMPVTASTAGGNASVAGLTGPVTLSSGGGNLSASRISGPLSLNTSGGSVQLTAITSPTLTAATGGGNIQAAGVSAAAVTARTGGGDIEIVFSGVPRDVQVNTSGGDITLVLPRGTTAYHVTAQTSGGSIADSLPLQTSSPNVIAASAGGGNITIREQ